MIEIPYRLMSGIAHVEFVILLAFLVFLCVRTRSKGLICVTAALPLIEIHILSYIVAVFLNIVDGKAWESGLDIRHVTKLTQRLGIAIITGGIEVVLGYGFCLLGAFLIYKEWQQGKFATPNLNP